MTEEEFDCPYKKCDYSKYKGCSSYKGIMVKWDEDFDVRVLCWLDHFNPLLWGYIKSVEEHEAILTITLINGITETEYIGIKKIISDYEEVCGDVWATDIIW